MNFWIFCFCVKLAKGSAKYLEKLLSKQNFICTDDYPTLADISCYEELSQCENCALDLFDFSPYPNGKSKKKTQTK